MVASAAKAGAAENKRAVIKEIAFMTSKIPPAAQSAFYVNSETPIRDYDFPIAMTK